MKDIYALVLSLLGGYFFGIFGLGAGLIFALLTCDKIFK